MQPRRTHHSNDVFRLEGGNEDSSLWVTRAVGGDGLPLIFSVFEPTPQERQAILDGANIQLVVWGYQHPPVMLETTTVPLGKKPGAPDEPAVPGQ